ncbi:CoA transferase [Gordonia amicalis]|uniref:CoA transferase n=1 Tax=Gordonia amicalis TaxID=89053 RepID=UPI0002A63109|nr:CoA transferase [Gordonia amicalis]MBA5849030.1 CoA transferase [Gordonia amicalis]MDV7099565.1 CoA transferase [Gordonia amicalis]MDV7174120.1 CoA transferase [Gordonia amicalis]NKX77776.1 CoA transferase [Gordonia amicalis]UOG20729.1 CoA transferase [Gordonia amicalis]
MSSHASHDPVRDWAASGIPHLTGRSDGPPLIPPGRAATLARELGDWIREASNGAADIDGATLLAERAALTGHSRHGDLTPGGSGRLLPADDGWVAVSSARPDDPLLLGALIGREVTEDSVWPAVAEWTSQHTRADFDTRATLLGIAGGGVAHGDEIAGQARDALRPNGIPRSVDGLLVVDFSALWAGPLCAHLLGLAGARVVKIETPQRPDGARRGDQDFYRLLHGGHASVVLDPTLHVERGALKRIVAAADIVIEASRPRALRGFGLRAEDFVASGTTWISITAAGRDSDRIGFGDDVAASAGLVTEDDAGLMFVGDAIADPLSGLTAAALAMCEPGPGRGALWDLSMRATVASTLGGPPPPPAYRDGDQWVVDTDSGTVPLDPPRARAGSADTAPSGRDTNSVLAGLGIIR